MGFGQAPIQFTVFLVEIDHIGDVELVDFGEPRLAQRFFQSLAQVGPVLEGVLEGVGKLVGTPETVPQRLGRGDVGLFEHGLKRQFGREHIRRIDRGLLPALPPVLVGLDGFFIPRHRRVIAKDLNHGTDQLEPVEFIGVVRFLSELVLVDPGELVEQFRIAGIVHQPPVADQFNAFLHPPPTILVGGIGH